MGRRRRRQRKKPAELALDSVLKSGTDLATPDCPLHRDCGGCSWQRIRYERQLQLKKDVILRAFADAGFEEIPLKGLRAAPNFYGYRNLMEFSFSARRWLSRGEVEAGAELNRDFALGLHAPGGVGRVLEVEHCSLQDADSNRMLTEVRRFALQSGKGAWNHRSHEGFWRFLRVRRGAATGERMLAVISSERDESLMQSLLEHLQAAGAVPTVLANGVTSRVADTSEGSEYFIDHGPPTFRERLFGFDYEIGPESFFQPNTETAEMIVREVLAMAQLESKERVLDLFCGAGTLSLALATKAEELVGYELVEASILGARKNAAANGIENVRFEVQDLNQGVPEALEGFDVIVSDPPRAGMHRRLIEGLIAAPPQRLVSVGCHPKSQAENLAQLVESGRFRLCHMVGIDQFPQTPHVENLALLERID